MSLQKLQKWPWVFLCLLIVSISIHLWVMSFSLGFRENTDVLRYKDWARIAYLYGFADTYTTQHLMFGIWGNNQPPGSVYVLTGAYRVDLQVAKVIDRITHETAGHNLFVNGPLVTIFLRLPSILADLGIGIVIYILVLSLSKSKNRALIASSLILLNPVIWYNSAVWGQMDGVNNVFFIMSLLFLTRKHYLLTAIFFFLSLYVKFSLLFILPFLLILMYKYGCPLKKVVLYPILSWFLMCILTFPVNQNPFIWLTLFVKSAEGEMQNITGFAFNFWWMVFHPHLITLGTPETNMFAFTSIRLIGSPEVSQMFLKLPLLIWSMIPLGLLLGWLLYRMIRMVNLSISQGYLILSLIALLGFLFLPRMHERYMYPVFAPFALYIGIKRKLLWIYVVLSVLNSLNLYFVWHPFPLLWLPVSIINNEFIQWSIATITVGIGLYMYICVIKAMRVERNSYEKVEHK